MSLVGVALVFLLITGPSTWIYQTGVPHHHNFQLMNWVDSTVPNAWIGTMQTGTLGYFPEWTINFDDKVKPEALLAQRGRAYRPIFRKILPIVCCIAR